AADTSHLRAIGVILNRKGGTPRYATFAGEAVGVNDILARQTFYGDANLDQVVDGTDYSLIDNGFNFSLSGWINGDFNYDAHIDGTDYALIDNAFNFQSAPAMHALSSSESGSYFGDADLTGLIMGDDFTNLPAGFDPGYGPDLVGWPYGNFDLAT